MRLKNVLSAIVIALISLSLIACGSGSGSSSAPPPFKLTPSPLQGMLVAGYAHDLYITAEPTTTLSGPIYIKVVADADIIAPAISVSANSDNTYTAKITTLAGLSMGHHTGSFVIYVCSDANCHQQIAGSPLRLPYDLEVISPEGSVTTYNLSPLTPLAGATDWGTFQGNAAHTGYVPATLNPSTFNTRWKWIAPSTNGVQWWMSNLVTGSDMFYAGTGYGKLVAYRESDGGKTWEHVFTDPGYDTLQDPAYSDGKIFVARGAQTDMAMYAIDALSGAQIFKSQMDSQWDQYLAPTVANGIVYSEGGHYGGMYAFDTTTGVQKFFAYANQSNIWTPAVDEHYAYAYTGKSLRIYNNQNGAAFGIIDPTADEYGTYTVAGAPVIGGPNTVFAGNYSNTPHSIVCFDTLNGLTRWWITGAYSQPSYANGALYAINRNSSSLESYSETNGTKLWTWNAPSGSAKFKNNLIPFSNIVLTNNLAFVSSETTTYAIDISTHLTVWSYPATGNLSISENGILYINGGQTITAINLH